MPTALNHVGTSPQLNPSLCATVFTRRSCQCRGRADLPVSALLRYLDGVTGYQLDALSLEYKRVNGSARGNLDVTNLVNNPAANGVTSVLGPSLEEEIADLLRSE